MKLMELKEEAYAYAIRYEEKYQVAMFKAYIEGAEANQKKNDKQIEDLNAKVEQMLRKKPTPLDTPLEKCGMSARLYNVLKSKNIITLGQLLEFSRQELCHMRNFSIRSLKEAELICLKNGYELREDD